MKSATESIESGPIAALRQLALFGFVALPILAASAFTEVSILKMERSTAAIPLLTGVTLLLLAILWVAHRLERILEDQLLPLEAWRETVDAVRTDGLSSVRKRLEAAEASVIESESALSLREKESAAEWQRKPAHARGWLTLTARGQSRFTSIYCRRASRQLRESRARLEALHHVASLTACGERSGRPDLAVEA